MNDKNLTILEHFLDLVEKINSIARNTSKSKKDEILRKYSPIRSWLFSLSFLLTYILIRISSFNVSGPIWIFLKSEIEIKYLLIAIVANTMIAVAVHIGLIIRLAGVNFGADKDNFNRYVKPENHYSLKYIIGLIILLEFMTFVIFPES